MMNKTLAAELQRAAEHTKAGLYRSAMQILDDVVPLLRTAAHEADEAYRKSKPRKEN